MKARAYELGYREGRRGAESIGNNTRVWRGGDGRCHCKRDDETTGLIIGAASNHAHNKRPSLSPD